MKLGKITGAMALTMAVATVPAMALNARGARTNNATYSQSQQHGDMFNRLDTNRDGVISRGEWTRDAAKFDRLDLNRDGVITQSEARQAMARRQARNGQSAKNGKRFRGMDRDGDGRITREEWRGNDQSFQQHDRNSDNVLSGDEMRGKGKGEWKQQDNDEQNESHHGKGHGAKRD